MTSYGRHGTQPGMPRPSASPSGTPRPERSGPSRTPPWLASRTGSGGSVLWIVAANRLEARRYAESRGITSWAWLVRSSTIWPEDDVVLLPSWPLHPMADMVAEVFAQRHPRPTSPRYSFAWRLQRPTVNP